MTIKITTWSPDTCDCVLAYEWDDSVAENQRTHSLYNVIRRCPDHQSLGTNQTVFSTVLEENPRKNVTRQLILDNAPTSVYDVDIESGTRDFKKGITASWSWSGVAPNRVLTLTVTGITLTANQKNAIQTKINERFGVGKVTFVN